MSPGPQWGQFPLWHPGGGPLLPAPQWTGVPPRSETNHPAPESLSRLATCPKRLHADTFGYRAHFFKQEAGLWTPDTTRVVRVWERARKQLPRPRLE